LGPPTWTWIFAASTAVTRVARVEEARAKRILKDLCFGVFSEVKPRKRQGRLKNDQRKC
jgi:hypothetical protein